MSDYVYTPTKLRNGAVGDYLTETDQVYDKRLKKLQEEINKDVYENHDINHEAIADVNARITEVEGLNPKERLIALETITDSLSKKVGDINSVVHAEFDDIPTKDSTKFVNSGAVYEAIHSSVINSISINSLDSLWVSDLYKHDTPSRYTVVSPFKNNNFKVGSLLVIADKEGHKLVQILTTSLNYDDEDGTINIDADDNPVVTIYRVYDYGVNRTSKLEESGWSRWNYVNKNSVEGVVKYNKEQGLTFRQIATLLNNIGINIQNTITEDNLNNEPNALGLTPTIPYRIPTLSAVYDFVRSNGVPKIALKNIDDIAFKEHTLSDKPDIYKVYDLDENLSEINVGILLIFTDIRNKNIIQAFISPYSIKTNEYNVATLDVDDDVIDVNILYRHRKAINPSGNVVRVDWSNWQYFGEDMYGGTIKYNKVQNLTKAEQERAISNIGITIDDDTSNFDAVLLNSESSGLPTSRYVAKAINAAINVLTKTVDSYYASNRKLIQDNDKIVIEKLNTVKDELIAKINKVYINNGIRVFDGFIPSRGRQPVLNTTTKAKVSSTGEVLWYPQFKTFIYRDEYDITMDEKGFMFYADWEEKSLYVDEDGRPYTNILYICDSANYKVSNGELELIDDIGTINKKLEDVTNNLNDVYSEIGARINNVKDLVSKADTTVEEVSYKLLVELIQTHNLIPNKKYRIIDFCSWFNKDDICTAGHRFDLIVEAIGIDILNPEATVVISQYGNDDYFTVNGVNVSEFKVLYNPMVMPTDIEKYAPLMVDDLNPQEMFVIINDTKEAFYCNSFESGKLYYYGKNSIAYSGKHFNEINHSEYTENFRYAEFLINPASLKFAPNNDDFIIKVYSRNSLDDTEFTDVSYKGTEVTILRPTGFIYKMIDDLGNEAPYDFKNLLNKCYKYSKAEVHNSDGEVVQEMADAVFHTLFNRYIPDFGQLTHYYKLDETGVKGYFDYYSKNSDEFVYRYTFNKTVSTNSVIPVDSTVANSYNLKPKNNKIIMPVEEVLPKVIVSAYSNEANTRLINNTICYDSAILVSMDFCNNCVLKDKVVILSSNEIMGESIYLIEEKLPDENIMTKSITSYRNEQIVKYINSLK